MALYTTYHTEDDDGWVRLHMQWRKVATALRMAVLLLHLPSCRFLFGCSAGSSSAFPPGYTPACLRGSSTSLRVIQIFNPCK